jgi:hypothetical protein
MTGDTFAADVRRAQRILAYAGEREVVERLDHLSIEGAWLVARAARLLAAYDGAGDPRSTGTTTEHTAPRRGTKGA